jgi:hypothetical protein
MRFANGSAGRRFRIGAVAALLAGALLGCEGKTLLAVEIESSGWFDCCVYGSGAQFAQTIAVATYSDGEAKEVTRDAEWMSSDEAVAVISTSRPGDIVRVSTGSVVITASYDGMTASLALAVP